MKIQQARPAFQGVEAPNEIRSLKSSPIQCGQYCVRGSQGLRAEGHAARAASAKAYGKAGKTGSEKVRSADSKNSGRTVHVKIGLRPSYAAALKVEAHGAPITGLSALEKDRKAMVTHGPHTSKTPHGQTHLSKYATIYFVIQHAKEVGIGTLGATNLEARGARWIRTPANPIIRLTPKKALTGIGEFTGYCQDSRKAGSGHRCASITFAPPTSRATGRVRLLSRGVGPVGEPFSHTIKEIPWKRQ